MISAFIAGLLMGVVGTMGADRAMSRRVQGKRAREALDVLARRNRLLIGPGRKTLKAATIRAIERTPEGCGVLVSDITSGGIDYSDGAFERILGLCPEAMAGDAWQRRIHPDDLPRVVMDTSDTDSEGTYRYLHELGHYVPIWFSWRVEAGVSVCYLRDAQMTIAREQLTRAKALLERAHG